MLQRDIVDKLYAQALRRYKKEHPNFKFTNQFADRLWFAIDGKLENEGLEAAENYVENGKLLEEDTV